MDHLVEKREASGVIRAVPVGIGERKHCPSNTERRPVSRRYISVYASGKVRSSVKS